MGVKLFGASVMSEYHNPEEGASLSGKDKPKLVTLAVLHMAQYFPAAFTAVALPFLFVRKGCHWRCSGC